MELQTSHADVYAAGDVAFFPEQVLAPRRIEHWDNAVGPDDLRGSIQ